MVLFKILKLITKCVSSLKLIIYDKRPCNMRCYISKSNAFISSDQSQPKLCIFIISMNMNKDTLFILIKFNLKSTCKWTVAKGTLHLSFLKFIVFVTHNVFSTWIERLSRYMQKTAEHAAPYYLQIHIAFVVLVHFLNLLC